MYSTGMSQSLSASDLLRPSAADPPAYPMDPIEHLAMIERRAEEVRAEEEGNRRREGEEGVGVEGRGGRKEEGVVMMGRSRFGARSRSWWRSGELLSEMWRCTTGEEEEEEEEENDET